MLWENRLLRNSDSPEVAVHNQNLTQLMLKVTIAFRSAERILHRIPNPPQNSSNVMPHVYRELF
jgi:hypothetical protein